MQEEKVIRGATFIPGKLQRTLENESISAFIYRPTTAKISTNVGPRCATYTQLLKKNMK